jgi:hypothetical protein
MLDPFRERERWQGRHHPIKHLARAPGHSKAVVRGEATEGLDA